VFLQNSNVFPNVRKSLPAPRSDSPALSSTLTTGKTGAKRMIR
jgi:hypothetical protein